MFTPDQLASAHKANAEIMFSLSNKVFDGMNKLFALNLEVMQNSLSESAQHTQRLFSIKDPQALFAQQNDQVQPTIDKVVAYRRQLYEIATNCRSDLAQIIESQMVANNQIMQTMVDNFAQNASPGSAPAVAWVQTAVNAANQAYQSAQQLTQQATEATQANLAQATLASRQAATDQRQHMRTARKSNHH